MGCPDAIVAHLAGLQSVSKIVFYPQSRTFEIETEYSFGKKELDIELCAISTHEKRHFRLVMYEEIF